MAMISLQRVLLPTELLNVGLAHTFTSQKEEIMGLLLGNYKQGNAHVTSMFICPRNVRAKDRVEVSPEALASARDHCDQLSLQTGEEVDVIGWYHSHPQATMWPSDVDLRTQQTYEMLDKRFFGLIFAFSYDKDTKCQKSQVSCFQTAGYAGQRHEVELVVTKDRMRKENIPIIIGLVEQLIREENRLYSESLREQSSFVSAMHNGMKYTTNICSLLEGLVEPIMSQLDRQLEHNTTTIKKLKRELERHQNAAVL